MKDETQPGAEPGSEAVPAVAPASSATPEVKAEKPDLIERIEDDVERVIHAIERWYAAHFHAASTSARTPITSDEKSALIASVTEAVAPAKE